MSFDLDVGARLKQVRTKRSLSQRELAKRAGVTNSTVSLIEQNRVSPSVLSLKKVLDGLPMSMEAFFADDEPVKSQAFYRADELPNVGQGSIVKKLVGYSHEPRSVALLEETYPPSCDTGVAMRIADGDIACLLVDGRLEVTVDGAVENLNAGDAFYIANQQAYRLRNVYPQPCRLVSAQLHLQV